MTEKKVKREEMTPLVINNLHNSTLQQIIQAEVMIDFYKSIPGNKEEKAKNQLKIAQLEEAVELNQSIVNYLCEL